MALTGLAVTEALLALWVALVVLLTVVGIGILLLPGALNAVRADARRQRRLALRWSGIEVDDPYLTTAGGGSRATGWRHALRLLGDSATWRDLLWLLVNPFVGPITFLPALAVVHGLAGLSLPFLWKTITESWENTWYEFIPIEGQFTANLAAGLGLVEILFGLLVLPRLVLPLHGKWVRFMLGRSSRAVLTSRVDHLTHTRSDTMDMQASELRRIERDLHDGAQVRLVALGMTLSAAESLIKHNPEAVAALLAEAKDNSVKALNELRDLVHGVHPPLLADRGLVDAVKTLALELPLRTEVTGSLPGRLPAPVESAAYFAIAELLNNAAKHGKATEVGIDIHYTDGVLRVVVHDNGVGGADSAAKSSSGLRGIERRLAAFDGVLALTSPAGGPTTAAFDIRCRLDRRASKDFAGR
ncbi:sensor domain-containing protein [Streptomyces sp. DT224]|uniref:sensor histidine kinase n=1 Tax=Streptomyces sp. DT224 TaxID=3393426 RepID=UPI003CF26B48